MDLRRRLKAVYRRKGRPGKPGDLRKSDGPGYDSASDASHSLLSSNASEPSIVAATSFESDDSVVERETAQQHSQSNVEPDLEDTTLGEDIIANAVARNTEVPAGEEIPPRPLTANGQYNYADPTPALDSPHLVDEQTLREQEYVRFEGEDETDYTQGPVRFVLASDGIKHGAALLMNLDLSSKVQRAIRAEREFEKAESAAEEETAMVLGFRIQLQSEIVNHKYKLTMLAETSGDAQMGDKAELEEQLSVMEVMMRGVEVRLQTIERRVESKARMLLKIQADVNAYLEDAFIYGNLLKPKCEEPASPVEPLNLQQEYLKVCKQLRNEAGDDSTSIAPLDTSREVYEPPALSPEQQVEAHIRNAYYLASRRLQEAQIAFDDKENERARQWQANYEAVERGEEAVDASPEDFDIRWLKQNQDFTRELIEAEEELESAKRAAAEANIDLELYEQASGFIDNVADGYRMSFEQSLIKSVPSPRIKNWVTGIPHLASPSFNERHEEADEWHADDVEISDSVSLVAEGADRKRIEKWRQVCGL